MKKILEDSGKIVVRFDRGEELVSALTSFVEKEHVGAGSFTAIGATDDVTVSYYNLKDKAYEDTRFEQNNMEVVNLTGNISFFESKPVIHMHGSFSGPDLGVFGGHVKSMRISVTCEVAFIHLKGRIERKHDETTGVNLMA